MKKISTPEFSTVLFHLAWIAMAASAFGVFVAMHRDLFGPSSENMYLIRNVWEWLARLFGQSGEYYPPEDAWSIGNVLRPALVGFCVSYLAALFLLCYGRIGGKIQLRAMIVIAVIIALPLLIMPNIWSSDVFDYIVYGRLPVVYHANPYVSAIGEYPTDVFYNMTCWKSAVSVYGPAWSLLSILYVALLEAVRAGPALYVLVFKLSSALCHLASGALLWKILTRANVRTRAFSTAVYLFSPLALIEFAGNGHNDSLMIALVLLGIHLAQRDRWAGASLAFTLAVQSKFYALPIFCLYVCYLWWRAADLRASWRAAFSAVAIFSVVSFILYLPFGLHQTTILAPFYGVAAQGMTKSLAEFIVYKSDFKIETLPVIGGLFVGNRQYDVQHLVLFLTFVLCVALAVRARSLSKTVSGMAYFAFFWTTVGATWFMPWYLTVPLALAPLSGSRAISFAAVLSSMSVFLIYLLEGWSYAESAARHNFMVKYFEPFIFGPPLAILAIFLCSGAARALWRIVTLRRDEWAKSN